MVNILFVETRRPGTPPGRYFPNDCAQLFRISGQLYTNSLTFQSIQHSGGDEGIRTPGLRRAKSALSQLSYIPSSTGVVGLTGFEPVTPALTAQGSNRLSYRPA